MAMRMALDFRTGYLIEPISVEGGLGVHELRIVSSKDDPRMVNLLFDPNTCAVDSFGDPTICTRIAIRTLEAKLRLLERVGGRRLFAIEAQGYMGPELRLALLPLRGQRGEFFARLLVMKDDRTIARILNLQPPLRRAKAAR
jgi:hypothetical protein